MDRTLLKAMPFSPLPPRLPRLFYPLPVLCTTTGTICSRCRGCSPGWTLGRSSTTDRTKWLRLVSRQRFRQSLTHSSLLLTCAAFSNAFWDLTGAFNPLLCPIWGFRPAVRRVRRDRFGVQLLGAHVCRALGLGFFFLSLLFPSRERERERVCIVT